LKSKTRNLLGCNDNSKYFRRILGTHLLFQAAYCLPGVPMPFYSGKFADSTYEFWRSISKFLSKSIRIRIRIVVDLSGEALAIGFHPNKKGSR